MNDQWIKSFILSAECGSFSKAASALYISVPSLVQQINLFEKELGFAVFERSSRGLKLTQSKEDSYVRGVTTFVERMAGRCVLWEMLYINW